MNHQLDNFKVTPILKRSNQETPSFFISFIWNRCFYFNGIKIQKNDEDFRRGSHKFTYPSQKFCGALIPIFEPGDSSFRALFEAAIIRKFETSFSQQK